MLIQFHFLSKSEVEVSYSDRTLRGIVWRELISKCTKSFNWKIEHPTDDIYHIFLKLWRRKKVI